MSYGKHLILMSALLVALPLLEASAEMATTTFGQSIGAVDALYPASTASSSAKTAQKNFSAEGLE